MKIIIIIITIVLVITSGCTVGSRTAPSKLITESQTTYSGLTVSGELDQSYRKASVSKIESLLGQKLPMPTYLPYSYQIKESYYYEEPNSSPQVTDILLLISDQPISWSNNQYTCRIALLIGWNKAGLGLKLPELEYIPEVKGRLGQNDNEYILLWESYGSPLSWGSTLELYVNLQFPRDEMIKIAASTPSETPLTK